YYFSTSSELTTVVSRTLFADLIVALSLVPVYMAMLVKGSNHQFDFVESIKTGMKPVALYTLLMTVVTFALFSFFGEPLFAAKMAEMLETANQGVQDGIITQEQVQAHLDAGKRFYSVWFYLPIVLLTNLFIGFLSSILAGLLVKK
ncbi:MAG: DUF4199 domain-containing protein, partial [Flavobacteriales bacterium]